MKNEKPDTLKFAKSITKKLKLSRFILVGETLEGSGQGKAFIMGWNGREFQNQIDMVGLLALGFRAVGVTEILGEQ